MQSWCCTYTSIILTEGDFFYGREKKKCFKAMLYGDLGMENLEEKRELGPQSPGNQGDRETGQWATCEWSLHHG